MASLFKIQVLDGTEVYTFIFVHTIIIIVSPTIHSLLLEILMDGDNDPADNVSSSEIDLYLTNISFILMIDELIVHRRLH